MERPIFFGCTDEGRYVFINLNDVSRVEVESGEATIYLRSGKTVPVADKNEARALIGILERLQLREN